MLHTRMNARERWVSIEDALAYLWPKIYGSEPINVDWSKRLPRAVYIKAHWPPTGNDREEFTAIHLDNLHILFDDPLYMPDDDRINSAIQTFTGMLADPQNIQDETYMIILGEAKKTASQVRWMRDVRERLTQPQQYYAKKRARDDRHRMHRKKTSNEAPVRCPATTDHLPVQAGGGCDSPSVHRHLKKTGQLDPELCIC